MTGNMNTPVAVETAPLAAPIAGRATARRAAAPAGGCARRRGCRRGSARSRAPCGRALRPPASAGRGPAPGRDEGADEACEQRRPKPRISGQSEGPNHACQMLVSSAGMTISAAASPGDMTRLRRPIATVGRPWPRTPLTKPASTKAKPATARMKVESGMSDLQRLAAHQPRLRGGGRDALAQHGAAQRADPVDQIEAEARARSAPAGNRTAACG